MFLYDRPRGPPGWQIYGSAKVGGASSGSLARPMGHGMSRVNVANFGSCSTQKWCVEKTRVKKHPFFSLELLSNPFQPSPEIDIPSVLGVGVQAISWNRFPPLLELRHVFRILQNRAVTLEFMTTWQGLPQSNNLARVLSNISNVYSFHLFLWIRPLWCVRIRSAAVYVSAKLYDVYDLFVGSLKKPSDSEGYWRYWYEDLF